MTRQGNVVFLMVGFVVAMGLVAAACGAEAEVQGEPVRLVPAQTAPTDPDAPAIPRDLTARETAAGVELRWTASDGAVEYAIWLDGEWHDWVLAPATAWTDTDPINGSRYQVRALGADGSWSSWTNPVSTSGVSGPPPIPTGLVAAQVGSDVELSWTTVAGAVEYAVWRDGGWYDWVRAAATTWTDPDPLSGARYQLRALGADGSWSGWTNPVDVGSQPTGCVIGGTRVDTALSEDECVALLALYDATDGPNWRNVAGWNTATDPCTWTGVTCVGGAVHGLRLRSTGLNGSLPADIAGLRELRSLNLEFNRLSGSIPPELGGLANLQTLTLNSNQLTGGIPAALGTLSRLRVLDLSTNPLGGSIPAELGQLTNLTRLVLSGNNLSGPIPPEIGDMPSLVSIIFQDNNLTGPIPSEIGNLANLTGLNLLFNDLTGPLPDELFDLTSLTFLYLNDADLTGPVPVRLGQLTRLEFLRLGNTGLTGPIPAAIGDLTQLRLLELADNSLTGPIPDALANLTALTALNLSGNQLTGPIPDALADLTALTALDLGSNQLTGAIPGALSSLLALRSIGLNDNDLTGEVPAWLADLPELSGLFLGGNRLSGDLTEPLATFRARFAINSVGVRLTLSPNGCFTADAVTAEWLDGFAPDWDAGCDAP